jgi:hypothetical protein
VGDARPDQTPCFALPPIYPEWLGDRALLAAHPARFCYVVGEMARGIATPRMVIAAVQAGCFGFYGSAGLPLAEIKAGLHEIRNALGPAVPGGQTSFTRPRSRVRKPPWLTCSWQKACAGFPPPHSCA